MKELRSPQRLVKMWHRRGKAAIDHLGNITGDAKGAAATTLSAYTSSGLAIEEQVRKAWNPSTGGLAVF